MRRLGCIPLALLAGLSLASAPAIAEGPASPSASDAVRHPITPHPKIGRSSGSTPASSGAWWAGTAGIALVLAAFGGISVAARRYLPKTETGSLRVVGRTSLSPKHSVYLLQAGDRVLIVGTGPQGSPTLLGEMPPETTTATPRVARFRVEGEA
jgi:flagellar protein FliO/FliZ